MNIIIKLYEVCDSFVFYHGTIVVSVELDTYTMQWSGCVVHGALLAPYILSEHTLVEIMIHWLVAPVSVLKMCMW